MEFFLLGLSYSTSGWHDIVQERASFDDRLSKVRTLISDLGGSFADFHFHDREPFQKSPPVVIRDKFAQFGSNDLIAILAMPDQQAAHAFMVTLRSFPHIADVRLTALMPWQQAIDESVPRAHGIIASNRFSGPDVPAKTP